MYLVVGGAYQGKTEYVKRFFKLEQGDIWDGSKMDFDALRRKNPKDCGEHKIFCIKNYHLLVKRMFEAGEDVVLLTEELLKSYPDVVIILDEIGNGIVPIDRSERRWREIVGKIGCYLAAQAESVVRIVCGLETQLK